ncbi:unnamed protein product [Cyprideis torosa]|uniref:Uncharacterized protein n=1 Tax=Cyprideis torosa TaxID=163714 RepID=A0A7R8W8R5_9CRUS|nr:unnamed protein product [Cyprideis torosa]CAG0887771.1 unnamed protein product [Cyprideis torosa]
MLHQPSALDPGLAYKILSKSDVGGSSAEFHCSPLPSVTSKKLATLQLWLNSFCALTSPPFLPCHVTQPRPPLMYKKEETAFPETSQAVYPHPHIASHIASNFHSVSCSLFVSYEFFFRGMQQILPSPQHKSVVPFVSYAATVVTIWKQEGFFAFYRGIIPTFWQVTYYIHYSAKCGFYRGLTAALGKAAFVAGFNFSFYNGCIHVISRYRELKAKNLEVLRELR